MSQVSQKIMLNNATSITENNDKECRNITKNNVK
jgi:hypothetical protein